MVGDDVVEFVDMPRGLGHELMGELIIPNALNKCEHVNFGWQVENLVGLDIEYGDEGSTLETPGSGADVHVDIIIDHMVYKSYNCGVAKGSAGDRVIKWTMGETVTGGAMSATSTGVDSN
ncbi:hypothetical protein ACLOJK_011847 [Asimina triloba]